MALPSSSIRRVGLRDTSAGKITRKTKIQMIHPRFFNLCATDAWHKRVGLSFPDTSSSSLHLRTDMDKVYRWREYLMTIWIIHPAELQRGLKGLKKQEEIDYLKEIEMFFFGKSDKSLPKEEGSFKESLAGSRWRPDQICRWAVRERLGYKHTRLA